MGALQLDRLLGPRGPAFCSDQTLGPALLSPGWQQRLCAGIAHARVCRRACLAAHAHAESHSRAERAY